MIKKTTSRIDISFLGKSIVTILCSIWNYPKCEENRKKVHGFIIEYIMINSSQLTHSERMLKSIAASNEN